MALSGNYLKCQLMVKISDFKIKNPYLKQGNLLYFTLKKADYDFDFPLKWVTSLVAKPFPDSELQAATGNQNPLAAK
jgi:hypothetical protein